jgi:flagellar protein FlbD
MIQLSRLNGETLVLNSDLIRYAEANPDTVITLVTGEKIVVAESCEELMARVQAYRSGLLRAAFPLVQKPVDGYSSSRETALGAKAASNAVETAQAQKQEIQAEEDKSWRRRQREED